MLLIFLLSPVTVFSTGAYSQGQVSIQNFSHDNLTVSTSENTTKARINETLASADPVTIGALASVAMNKVILKATQNVLNQTERAMELKEFVLRVSAQESNDATLNLNFSALDSVTSSGLAEVSIDGWIANSSGISTYYFSGLTDSNGSSTFNLHTKADQLYNTTLTVEAFLRGYSAQKQSAAFTFGGK